MGEFVVQACTVAGCLMQRIRPFDWVAVPLPNDELPMPVIDFAVTAHLRQLPANRHPLAQEPLLSLYGMASHRRPCECFGFMRKSCSES